MARGMARREQLTVTRIGIDEKAFAKGRSYLMVACHIGLGETILQSLKKLGRAEPSRSGTIRRRGPQ